MHGRGTDFRPNSQANRGTSGVRTDKSTRCSGIKVRYPAGIPGTGGKTANHVPGPLRDAAPGCTARPALSPAHGICESFASVPWSYPIAGPSELLLGHSGFQLCRIELTPLLNAGLSANHLRWLVLRGYAQHGIEGRPRGKERRSFVIVNSLDFKTHSCFILTSAGAAFARQLCPAEAADTQQPPAGASFSPGTRSIDRKETPHWNHDLRRLTFQGKLIKQIHRTAPDQVRALDKFEADGWPEWIDARSIIDEGSHFKSILHDTISSLNRNRMSQRIRFCSTANGFGIGWTLAPQSASHKPRRRLAKKPRAKRVRKSHAR